MRLIGFLTNEQIDTLAGPLAEMIREQPREAAIGALKLERDVARVQSRCDYWSNLAKSWGDAKDRLEAEIESLREAAERADKERETGDGYTILSEAVWNLLDAHKEQ